MSKSKRNLPLSLFDAKLAPGVTAGPFNTLHVDVKRGLTMLDLYRDIGTGLLIFTDIVLVNMNIPEIADTARLMGIAFKSVEELTKAMHETGEFSKDLAEERIRVSDRYMILRGQLLRAIATDP
jgi:hypothetical protein